MEHMEDVYEHLQRDVCEHPEDVCEHAEEGSEPRSCAERQLWHSMACWGRHEFAGIDKY